MNGLDRRNKVMKNKKLIFIPVALLIIAAIVFLMTQKKNQPQAAVSDPALSEVRADAAGNEQAENADETPAQAENTDSTEKAGKDNPDDKPREQPFLVQITDSDPSIAYVLVRMPNPIGLLPLPTEGEYTRTIRQTMDDGSEAINVLHLTPNGFWMEDANCEGQDCVQEGEVTLENREERILWNMVICLPHQLSLELITREEAMSLIR